MRSGRCVLALAILVGACALCAPMVWARGPSPGTELAQMCASDINDIVDAANQALTDELDFFENDLGALPDSTQVSQYLKLGTAASTRCDKIYKQAESKVNKLAAKCVAKLTRLGADPSAFTTVESTRESKLGALGGLLRYGIYLGIAEAVQDRAAL